MNNIEEYQNSPVYKLFVDIIQHIQCKCDKEYEELKCINDISSNDVSINDMTITNIKLYDNFIIFDRMSFKLSKIRKNLNNIENLYFYIKSYYYTRQNCNILNNITTRYEDINSRLTNEYPNESRLSNAIIRQLEHKNSILDIYNTDRRLLYNKITDNIQTLIKELSPYTDFIHSRLDYYRAELFKIKEKIVYNGFEKKYIILQICVRRNYMNYINKIMLILNSIQYLYKLKENLEL